LLTLRSTYAECRVLLLLVYVIDERTRQSNGYVCRYRGYLAVEFSSRYNKRRRTKKKEGKCLAVNAWQIINKITTIRRGGMKDCCVCISQLFVVVVFFFLSFLFFVPAHESSNHFCHFQNRRSFDSFQYSVARAPRVDFSTNSERGLPAVPANSMARS